MTAGLRCARIVPVLAVALACRLQPAREPDQGAASDDAAVEGTLVRFSAALAAGDSAALSQLVTPEFTLLDEGLSYDLAETAASARRVLARGQMTRRAAGFHTTVRGTTAWSHYVVTGEYRAGARATPFGLLEMAVLERRDGQWRVVLMATLPAAGEP